ncbi:MAG TPA: DUF2846 domain-containing protein [Nitrospinaceae bacterium]|nr:DUF2846 domain-containing protein [Nitrospinaceae bacterium]
MKIHTQIGRKTLKKIVFGLLVFTVLLSFGCAATGPKFHELPELSKAPISKSRVIFFRPDKFWYNYRNAYIKVNGNKIGEVQNAGYFVVDLDPGKNSIEAYAVASPGRYLVDVELVEGETTYFMVYISDVSVNAALRGGLIGQSIEFSKREKDKNGMFQMRVTLESEALPMIKT